MSVKIRNSFDQKIRRRRHLENLKAFLPDLPIEDLVMCCDLQPLKTWREWTDHLGNFIQVYENKRIRTFVDHEAEERITFDLYFLSHPKNIAEISKRALIAYGEGKWVVWFLGKDKKIRLVSYNNDWNKNSPVLSCGMESTIIVLNYLASDLSGEVDILSLRGPNNEVLERAWLYDWPLKEKIKGFPLC